LHRAVDKETGAIGAFDLAVTPEIEKDSRVAEYPTATIAGSNRLINVDGFERTHMRLEMICVLACAADRLTSTMIRFAAPQSTIPSRKQSRACGIDENA
jgi:hypothetical protein